MIETATGQLYAEQASKKLNALGVAGNEYPSGALSRIKSDGRNFVVFDPSLAEITKTYYRKEETVYSENFKEWFGDWKLANGVKELQAREAKVYKQHDALTEKKAEEELEGFGLVDNQYLGKTAFPKSFAGKILYHKGFPASMIIKHFADLYKDAILLNSGSEKDYPNKQHKKHNNIAAWHNLVNKFKIGTDKDKDEDEYYIRFTVKEGKVAANKKKRVKSEKLVHSDFV